ncbi:phosphatase PAP2 family protein [Rufibacter roseus]|uniref:Phosphatase PAP2 family protein n=1 Tax=Rufibacter roseus TaxID=1567108 RepID=A0ABW2DJ81_9BACT|nr:phosphatase PAP2 family protein [Rufibacter roseus]
MTTLFTQTPLRQLRHLLLVPCLWFSFLPTTTFAQVTSTVPADTLQATEAVLDTTLTSTKPLNPDLRKGELRKRIIAPAIFVGLGLLMIDNPVYDRHDFRYDLRTKPFPNFKTDIDDYTIFLPAVGLTAFNILSSQNRHDVTRQIGLLAASGALASGILWPLKKVTAVPRPNEENAYSFPSGHTTYAFVVATMVSREFKGKSKWIGIASYTAAGTTGMMRVLNDAHWFSDVLAGAGVGILSTNLVYLAHDRWFRNKGLNTDTAIYPTILPNGSPGVGLVIHLN